MQFNRLVKSVFKVPKGTKPEQFLKEDTVTVPTKFIRKLLADAVMRKGIFDDQYYLKNNPDVRAAIQSGKVKSGAEHYYKSGYFEGRCPKEIKVDEAFYLQSNPDVREAIKAGRVQSAQDHFDKRGFREGRLPFEGFALF